MNVLFIWDGSELSDFRIKCIKRARDVYPYAHFVCISKGNWPFNNYELIDWDSIKAKILERYGVGVDVTQPFSDFARFVFLSERKYTLYIDTDIYCKYEMPMVKCTGKYDICALWNGENTKIFHDALLNRNDNNIVLAHCAETLPRNTIDMKLYFSHKTIK